MPKRKPEYEQIKDGGAFVYISGAEGCLMCCDCGLVHRVRLFIADDTARLIAVEMTRDARKTAAARNRGEGGLQRGENRQWELRRIERERTTSKKGQNDGATRNRSDRVSAGASPDGRAANSEEIRRVATVDGSAEKGGRFG